MSIEAVAAVLHHSKAKGVSRAVLTAIAWHIGEDPTLGCYPSQERLGFFGTANKFSLVYGVGFLSNPFISACWR